MILEKIVQFLIEALVVYFVFRFFARVFGGGGARQAPRTPPRVPERAAGTLVRDPECGTYVLQSHAVQLKTGAETLFFCSPACRDAYQRRT